MIYLAGLPVSVGLLTVDSGGLLSRLVRVVLLSQCWTTRSALGHVVSEGPALGYLVVVGLVGRANLSGYFVGAGLLSPFCVILVALGHSVGAGLCSQRRAGVGLFLSALVYLAGLLCQRWTAQSALGYVVSEGTALGYLAGVGLVGRATLSGYLVGVGLLR